MNYKRVGIWLKEHDIVLERSFVDSFREYAVEVKKTII